MCVKYIIKVMISLAFCLQSNGSSTAYMVPSCSFQVMDVLSICLQSDIFVHIWCQMHFISVDFPGEHLPSKYMILYICCVKCILKWWISLPFAFKVIILYTFGVKRILQVMIFLAFAFKVMILYICGVTCILK